VSRLGSLPIAEGRFLTPALHRNILRFLGERKLPSRKPEMTCRQKEGISLKIIFRTTDGGETRTAQESGTTETLRAVFFMDGNTGVAVGASGTILRTVTRGVR